MSGAAPDSATTVSPPPSKGPHAEPPPQRLPVARFAALAGLLLGEYLYLSYRFDAQTIAHAAEDALPGVLSRAGMIGPLVIVVAAAVLLVSGRELRAELLHAFGRTAQRGAPIAPVLLNLACYAALLFTTERVFVQSGTSAGSPLLVLWFASALGTPLSLLPAALPLPVMRPLLPRVARALGVGLAAGALAFGAGLASTALWDPLSQVTLHLSASILRLLADEIVFVPAEMRLGLHDFHVTVAPICSGYEGIGLAVAFVGLHLWTGRAELRFPNAYLLLPLAVVAVFLANALRIALLIAVGSHISPEVALGGFHSKAGWLLFCAIALGLIAISRNVSFFATASPRPETESVENPASPYLLPLLALLATVLVTGLFSAGFDLLYPLRVPIVGAVLWHYRATLRPLLWPVSWQAPLLGVGVYAMWIALAKQPAPDALTPFFLGLYDNGPAFATFWIVFRAVGHVITVPIAEELAFRGYLLRRVMAPDFTQADPRRWHWPAAIVSSVAFGAMHSDWLPGIAAGLTFAYAQKIRGRLADAVAAHATANALIAADVLLRDNWWLWA